MLNSYQSNDIANAYLNKIIAKDTRIPIKKGCNNKVCYCTGDCQKIIGYVDEQDIQVNISETDNMFNDLKSVKIDQ